MNIYPTLVKDSLAGKKKFAVLVDPDKYTLESLSRVVKQSVDAGIDYFFVGGSLLMHDHQAQLITFIKENTGIPVVLFPGNNMQLNNKADGILLLSLISGRNPDMLIGRHVICAPYLKASTLEIIPTGYMLIESGQTTTVTYMSNTTPIPSNKHDIAACTAMAGEMLGMKLIYLDAGSGAANRVPVPMIKAVKASIGLPLIVGGGITSDVEAKAAFDAGADVVVVGNAIEKDPRLIALIAACRNS
jgi:putative glycerol-1-phosphate prenyltransferase